VALVHDAEEPRSLVGLLAERPLPGTAIYPPTQRTMGLPMVECVTAEALAKAVKYRYHGLARGVFHEMALRGAGGYKGLSEDWARYAWYGGRILDIEGLPYRKLAAWQRRAIAGQYGGDLLELLKREVLLDHFAHRFTQDDFDIRHERIYGEE